MLVLCRRRPLSASLLAHDICHDLHVYLSHVRRQDYAVATVSMHARSTTCYPPLVTNTAR